MNGHESAPGPAIDWAWATMTTHAEGGDCSGCRGTWCPTAEWALWVVITDRLIGRIRTAAGSSPWWLDR